MIPACMRRPDDRIETPPGVRAQTAGRVSSLARRDAFADSRNARQMRATRPGCSG
jgi:hypothetical protein